MAENIKDRPAFPFHPSVTRDEARAGMSLRDYFAAKAMTALIADPDRADQSRAECARLSFLMADAMLAAREAA